MKQTYFSVELVEFIPEKLEEGVLYVSRRYKTAVHRCACGCGEEVVTPLGRSDWSIRIANGAATLDPSIGNWSFSCQSHYFMRSGKVVWAGRMSRRQIEFGRTLDRRAREQEIDEINRGKALGRFRFLYRTWRAFKSWWAS
jgi:hypothetical protein